MNLEQWLYRRDREEDVLSVVFLASPINIYRHLRRQEEAEQEIERMLRA